MPKGKRKSYKKRSVDRKQSRDIKKLKDKVSRLVKTDEKKFVDLNVDANNPTAIDSTGLAHPLLRIPVWDTNNTNLTAAEINTARLSAREGKSVTLTSIKIEGIVQVPWGLTSDSNNVVRIMLVEMTDDIQTLPQIRDILGYSTSTSTGHDFLSGYRLSGPRHFRVHYDKKYLLQNYKQSNSTETATERFRRRFVIKAKLPKKGLKVDYQYDYDGSLGSNPVPMSHSFFLMAFSDSTTAAHPEMYWRCRIRYLDNV